MVENKELSFVDFFALLIRYRKIIVLPTFLFAVIYGVVLFVLPVVFPSMNQNKVEMICSVKVEQMSSTLSSYLDLDVSTLAEKNLKDFVNFSKIEKDYNIWTDTVSNERAFNTEIKNLFNSGVFSVTKEAKGLFRITSTVKESDVERFHSFITDYVLYCSSLVEFQVESLVDSAEKNIAQMIDRYEQSDSLTSDISSLLSLQLEFKNYRESHKAFIMINGQPFESNVAKGRVKKLFISIIAVFVLSLIISFVMNFCSQIRSDPEKSKIISDAWKAGK